MIENDDFAPIDEVEEEAEETEEVNEVNFEVLHPENPIMIRFQNALSQMLENKLNTLQEDLCHTENEIKKVRKEKIALSETVYTQKSELNRLEESLHQCSESVSKMILNRDRLKLELEHDEDVYKKELAALKNEEKSNAELRHKIEVQSYILQQLRNYEQDETSNLRIIQQTISKNEVGKLACLEEKMKKDYLLMKLENEVFKFELLIKDYEKQVEKKSDNLKLLQNVISTKNIDIEEITQDNSHLLKVWKHVVFLVEKQDDEYSNFKEELEKAQISHKEKVAIMNSYKQSAEKEMIKNEELVSDRNKKQQLLNRLQKSFNDVMKKKKLIENEVAEVSAMVECTDKNLKDSLEIQAEYNSELLMLENKFTKLHSEKYQLEEVILSQLQNEVVSNDTTSRLKDKICKLRDLTLKEKSTVAELNKKYADNLKLLQQKTHMLTVEREELEKVKAEIQFNEDKILEYENELNTMKLQIKKTNEKLDEGRKELSLLQEKPYVHSGIDEKIQRMRKSIKDTSDNIEKEKRTWMRKQNEIMMIVEKQSQLIAELNSLQEHVIVLQQKNSRLDQRISKANEETTKHDKIISHIMIRISKLNSEYDNQKQYGNSLDSENYEIQNQILEKLKVAEEDTTRMLQEIENLRENKDALEKELLIVQREDLEWEKKVKLATEMRYVILKEKSENGEIGSMKNEIHRMKIRYAQLKKAQDSLLSDLETCVSKRDRIFDHAIQKDNSKIRDMQKQAKENLTRQINNLRFKNLKLEQILENFEKDYCTLFTEKNQISEEIKNCESQIETLKNEIEEIDKKVREYHLLKHKNLETLIRQQRFADYFSRIKSGKRKGICRNELSVERDYMKNRYLQSDLIEVVQSLCSDFPEYTDELTRILNVLQSHLD